MNKFKVASFQLSETKKWAPAGQLLSIADGQVSIQEIEFLPEYRFDTKEQADEFFKCHFLKQRYTESIDN